MNNLQFKGGGTSICNKQIGLNEMRSVEIRSLIVLYTSQVLLFLGILLILFNNLDLIEPGSYFGALNWLTAIVFSIGLSINFISIPFLYFSSFKNFKRESDFWDRETFWILPLFFFGTFFLRNSEIKVAFVMLTISVVTITLVHMKFFLEARKVFLKNVKCSYAGNGEYFMTLKYLSAYYVLLLASLVFYNPLQQLFLWIRVHV